MDGEKGLVKRTDSQTRDERNTRFFFLQLFVSKAPKSFIQQVDSFGVVKIVFSVEQNAFIDAYYEKTARERSWIAFH